MTTLLTSEQIHTFDSVGFLSFDDCIPQDMLGRLTTAASEWVRAATREDLPDHAYTDSQRKRVFRINHLQLHCPEILELLGSPQILALAESLCGPNFVPAYESLVVKHASHNQAILWHQDMVHSRSHRIATVGVYLDKSRAGGGALRLLPGTQHEPQDICELTQDHGWQHPDSICLDAEPGHLIAHDSMVVHGSDPQDTGQRRTIYFEFRAAEQLLADGPWDRDWIRSRMKLMALAQRSYLKANPGSEPYPWNVSADLAPGPLGETGVELQEIYDQRVQRTTANHCLKHFVNARYSPGKVKSENVNTPIQSNGHLPRARKAVNPVDGTPSPLRFSSGTYDQSELKQLLLTFRERGYVILRNVFERDSVDEYLQLVLNEGNPDSLLRLHPIYAPKVRQVLQPALSHSQAMARRPSLYHATWHITEEDEAVYNQEWHVDHDPEGPPTPGYHYPREVDIGFNFQDMEPASGPTQVVACSHLDPSAYIPNSKRAKEFILCRKEDAFLWDRRMWHRVIPRTLSGPRVFADFGFFASPTHQPLHMPPGQQTAWLKAQSAEDQVFFGGPFSPLDET